MQYFINRVVSHSGLVFRNVFQEAVHEQRIKIQDQISSLNFNVDSSQCICHN